MKPALSTSNDEFRVLLNQLVRLRLFRNTNRELGEYIGYNLQSNNSIKNISAFTARCIFHELNREIEQQLEGGLDLEIMLKAYKAASKFYDEHLKGRKKILQKENLFILLKRYYVGDYQIPEEKLFLKKTLSEIDKKDIRFPYLLLLALEILPLYTSKKGDVNDISGDFNKLFSFIKEFIQHEERLFNLPVLNQFEKEVRSGKIYCNRLYLIYVTLVSLETYRGFMNPEKLYAMVNGSKEDIIAFDLDNSFWVEPEMLFAPAVFWEFVRLNGNMYFLYCYSINTEKKLIYYTRHDAIFFRDERNGLVMQIDHPEKIFSLLGKDKILNYKLNVFACEIDTSPTPDIIRLQPLMNNDFNFPHQKFIRLKDEGKTKQLRKCLEKGIYEIKNKFPDTEYFFQNTTPSAITKEYIYFKKETESGNENKIYYRVPKNLNDGLPYITINDSMGILELKGRKYIAFDPLYLYIEVTDDICCAENEVDIVSEIVI